MVNHKSAIGDETVHRKRRNATPKRRAAGVEWPRMGAMEANRARMTSARSTSTATDCARTTLALISCCSCWPPTSPHSDAAYGVPVRAFEGTSGLARMYFDYPFDGLQKFLKRAQLCMSVSLAFHSAAHLACLHYAQMSTDTISNGDKHSENREIDWLSLTKATTIVLCLSVGIQVRFHKDAIITDDHRHCQAFYLLLNKRIPRGQTE